MKTLVLGASGATGKHLTQQLLEKGREVKVIVRSKNSLPESWQKEKNLEILELSISEVTTSQMSDLLRECDSVASCLGHNISFKGIYGKPRRLVTDAVKLVISAIKKSDFDQKFKFLLMNTSGNRNRDLNEPISIGERIVIALLRLLLPPHPDNEQAAEFLRVGVGHANNKVSWVAVRPDGLIDEDEVTDYDLHPSPISSPIFNPGKTSRINVGNFMSRLIVENELWDQWKGKMPVIYNKP